MRDKGAKGAGRVQGGPHPSRTSGEETAHERVPFSVLLGRHPFTSTLLDHRGPSDSATKGAEGCHHDRHSSEAEWLPVLSTLASHPEGAIVADLAAELGASVTLVERRLYSLKRQGLVKTERLGTPPVIHWLAL